MSSSNEEDINAKIDAVIDLLDLCVANSKNKSGAADRKIEAQGNIIAIAHKTHVDHESAIIDQARVTHTQDICRMQIEALKKEIVVAASQIAALDKEDEDIGRQIKKLEDWLEARGEGGWSMRRRVIGGSDVLADERIMAAMVTGEYSTMPKV